MEECPYLVVADPKVAGKILLGIVNPMVGELAAVDAVLAERVGDRAVLYIQLDAAVIDTLIGMLVRLKLTVGHS